MRHGSKNHINNPNGKFPLTPTQNPMKYPIFALGLAAGSLMISQADLKSADAPKSRQNGYADAIQKTSKNIYF